jgi:hypothetical protein
MEVPILFPSFDPFRRSRSNSLTAKERQLLRDGRRGEAAFE